MALERCVLTYEEARMDFYHWCIHWRDGDIWLNDRQYPELVAAVGCPC